MDATKTRDELVNRALGRLGIVGAGQTASDEDYDVVDGLVDFVVFDLAARKVYAIADEDAIPSEAVEYVAALLAQAAASDFLKPVNPQIIEWAEAKLRQISASEPTYEYQRATYY